MLSDYQIIEAATIEYQIELDRGLSLGEDKYPFLPVVKRVTPDQMIEVPGTNNVTLIWSEPDIRMQKDEGEVPFKSLPLKSRSLEVERYVDGIAEELHKLRHPLIRQQYAEFAGKWAGGEGGVRWTQYEHAWDRLLNGDTLTYGAAYDGQPLFDANHPGGDKTGAPTTYSNLFTAALSETALDTVVTAMQQYRNSAGLPFGNSWMSSTMQNPQSSRDSVAPTMRPSFHLFVGPKLASTAHDLAKMATASPSKFAGAFTWSTISELVGTFEDYWLVMFLDEKRKPLSWIDGGAGILLVRDGYDTEPGRLHGRAEWVLRAQWGFTYDRWDVIAMSTGTGA